MNQSKINHPKHHKSHQLIKFEQTTLRMNAVSARNLSVDYTHLTFKPCSFRCSEADWNCYLESHCLLWLVPEAETLEQMSLEQMSC